MDLRVFLKLDGSGFQQGLTSAKQGVKRFGEEAFGGLKETIFAAFTVGAIVEMSKKTIEWAGHVQDLSDRLGVSVEYLQQMQYVARRSGSSVDTLAGFFEKLAANRMEALSGTEGGAKKLASFEKLGVSANTLSTTGTQGLTDMIAKAFQGSQSPEMLIGALREVGGKGAGELIAAFTKGLADGRQAAVDAGAVMSESTVAQLADLNEEMIAMQQEIMVEVAPAILKVVEVFRNLSQAFVAASAYVQGFIEKISAKTLGNALKLLWQTTPMGALTTSKEDKEKTADELGEALYGAHESGKEGFKGAVAESVDADAKRKKEAEERAAAREARRHPAAIPIQTYQPKEHEAKKATDSLISVGNFLGSGRSTLESIGAETNNILRDSRELLKQIAKQSTASATPNSTMQVPAT